MTLRSIGIAFFAVLALVALPVAPAFAVPSPAICDAPTRTVSGGGPASVVVHGGEVVELTGGTFTGPLHLTDREGTVCVAADATLNPKSVKDPAGDMIVIGEANLPSVTSVSGFDLVADGTVTLENLILVNSSEVTVTTSGRVSTGELRENAGSQIDNAGLLDARLTTTIDSTVLNSGTFVTHSGLTVDGVLRNSGHVEVTGGAIRLSPGATMSNECVIDAGNDIAVDSNNSSGITNSGIIRALSGALQVGAGGALTQTSAGIVVAATLDNAGTITGFGRYRFALTTNTRRVFAGASSAQPITVQDLTPPAPPRIFDLQTATVVNTEAGEVADPPPSTEPGTCAGFGARSADVIVTKSGPATVDPGGTVNYTITVHNAGPDAASTVVVTDTLPPALTNVIAGGGTVSGGTVLWTLPSLVPETDVTFTVTGSAPSAGTLVNTAHASAVTQDPNPANNDGSTPGQSVETVVNAAAPPPNHPPSVGDAVVSTRATQTVAGTVAVNDPDQGQQVITELGVAPADGTATVSPDGVFDYTPDGSFTGVDSFTVRGCDNADSPACATGTVSVVVAPLAVDDAATTELDVPVSIAILTNDIGDVTGGPFVDEPPAHGIAAADGDNILYTPASGFVGVDSFTYRICSRPVTVCGTAAVSVEVTAPPANIPPVAADTAASGPADSPVGGHVTASDPDAGQQLTATLASPPSSGSATVQADGAFTFTPPPNVAGTFTFTVRVCDDFDPPACDTATVTVSITPVAHPDAAETTLGTPVTFSLTANDRGGVGAPTLVTPAPSNGTVVIGTDGQATYTPNAGFTGQDTFDYRVCATSAPTLCATGTATVTVGQAPPPPVSVEPAELQTTATVPVEGDLSFTGQASELTFTITAPPTNGTASVDATGRVVYTPTGAFTGRDQFTVQACDRSDPSNCGTAPVRITVSPVAGADTAFVTANGDVDIPVEDNDIGTVGPIQIVTQPVNGAAQVVNSILYTPRVDFVGTDTFTYRICSVTDLDVCATARVDVFVQPLATDDTLATDAGIPGTSNILNNDTIGGSSPAVTILTPPTNGTASFDAGVLTYTPTGAFTGHDSLVYQVCAASGPPLCSTAPVAIDVAPDVNPVVAATIVDTAVSIDVTANDFGDAGVPVVSRPPAHGTVTGDGLDLVRAIMGTGNANLSTPTPLVYTPNPGYVGPDSFTYIRCAPTDTTLCNQTAVVVTVHPTTVPPTEPPPTSGSGSGSGGGSSTAEGGLSVTGVDDLGLLVLAGLLVGGGIALVAASRWRRYRTSARSK
jgi:uncharacterized repeat protein (TIGR01451 family)